MSLLLYSSSVGRFISKTTTLIPLLFSEAASMGKSHVKSSQEEIQLFDFEGPFERLSDFKASVYNIP